MIITIIIIITGYYRNLPCTHLSKGKGQSLVNQRYIVKMLGFWARFSDRGKALQSKLALDQAGHKNTTLDDPTCLENLWSWVLGASTHEIPRKNNSKAAVKRSTPTQDASHKWRFNRDSLLKTVIQYSCGDCYWGVGRRNTYMLLFDRVSSTKNELSRTSIKSSRRRISESWWIKDQLQKLTSWI